MTHQERNNLVAIINSLLVTGFFATRIFQMYQQGAFEGPDGLAIWAQTVLWIIPASIIGSIVLTILFNIFYAIATNNSKPSFVVDERDKMLSNRSMITTMIVVSAGFILSLVALAFGWPSFVVLNMILLSFAVGDLIGSLVKLVMYRWGA